ncbi:hypothetical protein D043_4030A, partial [Vibrio parahaemolyticus EKP-021]
MSSIPASLGGGF